MDFEEPSKPAVLMIEAAGLTVTGLLLLTIAYTLQLIVGLLTQGALEPPLGMLAFGALFYVVATFVAFGTHRRPDHPVALVANVALHAGFLCCGWLLWMSEIPLSWLGLGLAFTLLVQGGAYAFARLRKGAIRRLVQQHGAAVEDAFVERFFLARPFAHLAIPSGAALGLVLASGAGEPAASLPRHALAGVFAVLAVCTLLSLLAGFRELARDLIAVHSEPRVVVKMIGSADRYQPHVFAPASMQRAAEANAIAADVRRVLLINQLRRLMYLALSVLVLNRLELANVPLATMAGALLALALVLAAVPSWIGRRAAQARTGQR